MSRMSRSFQLVSRAWLLATIVPVTLAAQAADTGLSDHAGRLPSDSLVPAAGKWLFVNAKHDSASKSDQQLVLQADDSVITLADWVRPMLLISCGSTFRASGDRAMVLMAGEALDARPVMTSRFVRYEARFNTDRKPSVHKGPVVDNSNRAFYIGDFGVFLFSVGLFKSMLEASSVRIGYTPALSDYTVTAEFQLAGLSDALSRLDHCDWPRP